MKIIILLATSLLAPGALAQAPNAAKPAPAATVTATSAIAATPAMPPTPRTASAPTKAEPTRIFRQVLPDGRIVYSDENVAGARLDHTITMPAPIEGNLWSTEPGQRPQIAPQTRQTPVQRVDPVRTPAPGKSTIAVPDAALAEVMRAEMLLEDAKKRQAAGVPPLPGEQRDNSDGGLSYNQAYFSRQRRLARDVEYAQEELKKALVVRDGVRAAH